MNLFQKLLKWLYPARMKLSEATGLGVRIKEDTNSKPITSFYDLKAINNKGEEIAFKTYAGKSVLLVNLASRCGFTSQYAELEKLHQRYAGKLEVLGFPSNDFGAQEPGSDQEIAEFCRKNYGVSFPLFKKDHVTGRQQQLVYQWLSNSSKNGWNDTAPTWNFCKYLVNEKGYLTNFYTAAVSPLSEEISEKLK